MVIFDTTASNGLAFLADPNRLYAMLSRTWADTVIRAAIWPQDDR